ncbi:glycosyltransferase [Butyrivibrio fibrisolvens]|uniref:glycosyltransferase n=1 Tax=Butyrivibrio fibrisolvens TaxID=831 RepID=UPI000416427B|nr:glycosyltransferase [Butyrivibrio fibrisolvens]
MIKISVIVPVYNVEKYVIKCVDSIINQTYKNLEIILVDDGSTDTSGEICDEYQKKDDRIKVFHTENRGLSCARNYGIKQATGEYIAFLDSDDYVYGSYIEDLYGLCKECGADIAQCDFIFVLEDSAMLKEQIYNKVEIITGKEAVIRCCKQPNAVKYNVAWNKLYKKKLFDDLQYPEGRIHEDEFTSYKLFFKADKVAVTSKYLHCYVQRKDSITDKKFDLKKLDRIDAYEERLAFLKNNGIEKAYNTFLTLYYQSLCGTIIQVRGLELQDGCALDKLLKIKSRLEKEIWNSAGKSFSEKLRIVYPNISEEEKEVYKRLHVSDNLYSKSESFSCPFGIIPKGSRIILFGAGKVGQEYYRQIINSNYAEIVDWVDNAWKSKASKGMIVSPINNIVTSDFDYVLIGIKELEVALEIKENLIAWGIDSRRILWKSPICLSINDATEIKDAKKYFAKLSSSQKKCILFNTPEHGNLGDHALAMASKAFLEKHFSDYSFVEVSGKQWDYLEENIVSIIGQDDLLFIVGGGYMGSVWPKEDNRVKNFVSCFPDNKVFFLPQTFFYEGTNCPDSLFWNEYTNVYFVHREGNSFDYFTQKMVKEDERNALFPDMVLGLEYKSLNTPREGIGLCFRSDKESMLQNSLLSEICNRFEKENIRYELTDTVLKDNVSIANREEAVLRKLNEFSRYELLITDRLHGMIFAAITQTPCIALNNKTGKVFGVYQWIKNKPYIKIINNSELTYDNVLKYFHKKLDLVEELDISHFYDEMADWIRRRI